MIVDVFGIEAFLPGSQIDVKPIRDYDVFVGKTMEFKIVKINQEFRNVVVSHKALIEAELEAQKKDIISKLEKGQVLEGTVKNITSYGVFVDLGGVDGSHHRGGAGACGHAGWQLPCQPQEYRPDRLSVGAAGAEGQQAQQSGGAHLRTGGERGADGRAGAGGQPPHRRSGRTRIG